MQTFLAKLKDEKLKLRGRFDLFGMDIRTMQNLYWEQTACIQFEKVFSKYTQIERGIRQGFKSYSEAILRKFQVRLGFIIGGCSHNNIRYAHDVVL